MDLDIINYYKEIKKIISKLDKFNIFELYDEKIFVNFFASRKKNEYLRFSSNIFGNYNGIELFFNNRGYNYLHDTLTLEENAIRYDECDSITLLILNSCDVSMDEGKYIHSLGMKIKKENNLIIYRNRYGKKTEFANLVELEMFYSNLTYIAQIIFDEKESIDNNYKSDKIPHSFVDDYKSLYSINYLYLENLEWFPKKEKCNIDFVNEFKNGIYNPKESYMLATFYPMIIKETNVKPLLITFLSPNDKMVFKYITSSYAQYKYVLFGILDEIFSELKYIPSKIYFDNRDIYQILSNTLDGLNIEHELFRNVSPFDAKTYLDKEQELDFKKEMNLDANIQPKSVIETFLDFICKTVSNLNIGDIETDLDIEDDIDTNSNKEELVQ